MSDIKYSWPLFKKCILKIVKISCTGQNMIFPILLVPLLAGTIYSNILSIRATRFFSKLLKRSPEVTLSNYVYTYISAEGLKLAITATFDILLTNIYSASQSFALRDYMQMDWKTFKSHSVGDLSLRHFEKSEMASVFVYTIFPDLFTDFSYLSQVLLNIYKSDSSLVFIALISSVFAHVIAYCLFLQYYNFYTKNYTDSKVHISSVVANEVSNFDIIKSYSLEDSSVDRVKRANLSRRDAKNKLAMFVGKADFFYRSLEIFTLVSIFLLSKYFKINSELISVIDFTVKIHEHLRKFLNSMIKCNESFYVYYMLDSTSSDQKESDLDLDKIETIEARDLEFEGVFSNLNFTVNKGEKIAIVGKNGCGKTVLIKTLSGFTSFKGSLVVNGVDYSSYRKSSLRSKITVVSQTDYYTTGTIMKNLKYGNKLEDHEIISKCKEWGVHSVIESIEGGYEKISSTGGTELSGGQKQRISLMRGVLRDTNVLILDDCLSSISTLDRDGLISKVLDLENKTLIMVVKSEQFISRFDKVLILDGNNSLFGKPEDLMEQITDILGSKY